MLINKFILIHGMLADFVSELYWLISTTWILFCSESSFGTMPAALTSQLEIEKLFIHFEGKSKDSLLFTYCEIKCHLDTTSVEGLTGIEWIMCGFLFESRNS